MVHDRAFKHVVIQDDLHASDIRPPKIMSEFRNLSIKEAWDHLLNPEEMEISVCPACGSDQKSVGFEKYGFQYDHCNGCGTLYVSNRPTAGALDAHRGKSKATKFRSKEFLAATSKARRFHVLHSNALWMGRLFDEMGNIAGKLYADYGTNYPIIFDEVKQLSLFEGMCCIDPLPGLEDAAIINGATLNKPPENEFGLISAFEQFERFSSPRKVLEKIHRLLVKGGLLVFTTRTISGFDLQVLWDQTPYIYVPEHLNLFSIEGLTKMLEGVGFELVELSTPGQLDVELVLETVRQHPAIKLPPFVDYMIHNRSKQTLKDFQEFLQRNRLSSHVRAAAIKRTA